MIFKVNNSSSADEGFVTISMTVAARPLRQVGQCPTRHFHKMIFCSHFIVWKLSQNIIIGLYSISVFMHAFHSQHNTDFDALNSRKKLPSHKSQLNKQVSTRIDYMNSSNCPRHIDRLRKHGFQILISSYGGAGPALRNLWPITFMTLISSRSFWLARSSRLSVVSGAHLKVPRDSIQFWKVHKHAALIMRTITMQLWWTNENVSHNKAMQFIYSALIFCGQTLGSSVGGASVTF